MRASDFCIDRIPGKFLGLGQRTLEKSFLSNVPKQNNWFFAYQLVGLVTSYFKEFLELKVLY